MSLKLVGMRRWRIVRPLISTYRMQGLVEKPELEITLGILMVRRLRLSPLQRALNFIGRLLSSHIH